MRFKAAISSLTMVGTVHRDPKGFSKLSRLLENERPDLISVEISPYARALRARRSAGFRATLRENLRRISKEEIRPFREIMAHGAILGIYFLLKEPYESHPPFFWPVPTEVKEREASMAGKIRELFQVAKGGKLLHIGGWEHLIELPSGKSLFGLLKDLRPRRVLWSSNGN